MITVLLRLSDDAEAMLEDGAFYCVVNGKYHANKGNKITLDSLKQSKTVVNHKGHEYRGQFNFVPGNDTYECWLERLTPEVSDDSNNNSFTKIALISLAVIVVIGGLWFLLSSNKSGDQLASDNVKSTCRDKTYSTQTVRHASTAYNESYINEFREVWLNMQTLYVTYADVKKAKELFENIENDGSIKAEYREKVYEKVRENDGIIGALANADDKNRETIKYKIEQFEKLFNDITNKKINDKSYLTSFRNNNTSYLSKDQKEFFDTWSNSPKPDAYKYISDFGENTSLKDIRIYVEY